MLNASNVNFLEVKHVGLVLLGSLIALCKFLFFLLLFAFHLLVEGYFPEFSSLLSAVVVRHVNLSIMSVMLDHSLAFDNAVVFDWQVVLLGFVVESEVVLFAFIWRLCLHILLGNIYPVAHAALCNALKQQQLFFGSPVSRKDAELQVVKNNVPADSLRLQVVAAVADGHSSTMALKADHQRFV